ncbi:MAG: hypothetical protein WC718_16695 [Phycisphaerales bacterium]|jgi:hypothetical protein
MKHALRSNPSWRLAAGILVLAGTGILCGCETNQESHYGVHVLDNQRWVLEDQVDALSETRLRRHARNAAWFFSEDRGNWDDIGDQISDSEDRWARLADPWPARNLPAEDIDLED